MWALDSMIDSASTRQRWMLRAVDHGQTTRWSFDSAEKTDPRA
jgi:hypothetical protein